MPEALLANANSENELDAFRRIYDCEIKMFGNAFFHPGCYVYVNPSIMGLGNPSVKVKGLPSTSRLLGLGGYFMVTEVGNPVEPGNFETTLKCRWVAFGDGVKGGNEKDSQSCENAMESSAMAKQAQAKAYKNAPHIQLTSKEKEKLIEKVRNTKGLETEYGRKQNLTKWVAGPKKKKTQEDLLKSLIP